MAFDPRSQIGIIQHAQTFHDDHETNCPRTWRNALCFFGNRPNLPVEGRKRKKPSFRTSRLLVTSKQQRKLDSASATSPAATSQNSLADKDMEFRKRQKETQEKAAKSEKEQAAAAEKQENCANMQRQLRSLESGERIARRDDNGERYFLEDAQREQEIAKLRQSVQACN